MLDPDHWQRGKQSRLGSVQYSTFSDPQGSCAPGKAGPARHSRGLFAEAEADLDVTPEHYLEE
jgi:hypothetical protein